MSGSVSGSRASSPDGFEHVRRPDTTGAGFDGSQDSARARGRSRSPVGERNLTGQALRDRIKDSGAVGSDYKNGHPKRTLKEFADGPDFLEPKDDQSFKGKNYLDSSCDKKSKDYKKELKELAREEKWDPRRSSKQKENAVKADPDDRLKAALDPLAKLIPNPKRRYAVGTAGLAAIGAGIYGLVKKLKPGNSQRMQAMSDKGRFSLSDGAKNGWKKAGKIAGGLTVSAAAIFGATKLYAKRGDLYSRFGSKLE